MRSSTIDRELRLEREFSKQKSRREKKKEKPQKYSTSNKVKIIFTYLFRLGIL